MAKANAEIKELTEAIKTLTTVVMNMDAKLTAMTLSNNKAFASLEEMNHVVQNISVKLDCFNNEVGMTETAPKPKRAPAKKKAAETKVAETKVATEVKDKESDTTSQPEVTGADETEPTPTPAKRQVRKTAAKKVIEEPPALDNAPPVETKTPVVKPAAARAAKPAPATRQINKMEFFKQRFNEDPSYFDEYLTEQVKAAIRTEHAAEWGTLAGDALKAEERKAYYNYMTKNYDKQLISMKTEWISDQANASVKIVGKESA